MPKSENNDPCAGYGAVKMAQNFLGNRYLASSRMFGNLSAGQARVAAYSGNFAGAFGGDAATGAAAGVCGAISSK